MRDSLPGDLGYARGVQVDQGTSLDLTNVVIRDVAAIPGVEGGAGLGVQDFATLTASNVLIERASSVALQIQSNSVATVTDLVVRDTQPDGTPDFGRAIGVQDGSSLTVIDALLENNIDVGAIFTEDTTGDLQNVTIRGTDSDEADSGTGLSVQYGSHVTATDLLLEGNTRTGMTVATASADLVRATIRSTRGDPFVGIGSGLHLQLEGTATVEDLLIEDCIGQGIAVGHAGSLLEADGLIVRGTQSLLDGGFGHGLSIVQDGEAVLQDALIDANRGSGLVVRGGAAVTLTDVVVQDTIGGSTEPGGVGIIVQDGELTAVGLDIASGDGPGVFHNEGLFDCTDCTITDSGFASAVVLDGVFTMDGGALDGSTPTSDLGGGGGVFVWPFFGVDLTLTDVDIVGHPGPAAYFRGPSNYVLDGVSVSDSGTLPLVPGAVVVLEGIEPFDEDDGTGLLVTGSSFDQLPASALFFDSSGGTLDEDNVYGDVGEYTVWSQNCDDAPELVFLGEAPTTNACEGAPRDLDPLLIYELELLDMFSVQE